MPLLLKSFLQTPPLIRFFRDGRRAPRLRAIYGGGRLKMSVSVNGLKNPKIKNCDFQELNSRDLTLSTTSFLSLHHTNLFISIFNILLFHINIS